MDGSNYLAVIFKYVIMLKQEVFYSTSTFCNDVPCGLRVKTYLIYIMKKILKNFFFAGLFFGQPEQPKKSSI